MKRLMTFCLCVLFVSSMVMADWYPGDGHKMHYAQLPDPFGWDVFASTNLQGPGMQKVLADDWRCSQSGPVEDIHLWGSWKYDMPGEIEGLHVSIHDDIPAGIAGPYSMPGNLLWEWEFYPGEFTVRNYGTGDQGWYNPNTNEVRPFDHHEFHQINIENITDPFIQEVGKIYWLDITVFSFDSFSEWGWKTSMDHWNDDAVWTDYYSGGGYDPWNELLDPMTGESLDLAFVITPEPTTVVLLGLGGLLLRKKRKA